MSRPLLASDLRIRGFTLLEMLVVLVLAVIYVALTMLADLMNAVLDPRLRGP